MRLFLIVMVEKAINNARHRDESFVLGKGSKEDVYWNWQSKKVESVGWLVRFLSEPVINDSREKRRNGRRMINNMCKKRMDNINIKEE